MCAINPKHEKHFTLSVYTSMRMDDEWWEQLVFAKLMEVEITMNADMRLRWHITEKRG